MKDHGLGFAALASLMLIAGSSLAGPVNINTADAETLARELNGVGPATAAEIIRDREANGPFASPEALMRVTGIGERVLERNRQFILTDSADRRN